MDVYLFYRAEIASLNADETFNSVSSKYTDFADIFSQDLVAKLLKVIGINDYTINLIVEHQSLYGPIYSLRLIELKTLKIYIVTNLTNGFIKLSKSPTSPPIFFVEKLNWSVLLCVDYKSLNNQTIKN